MLGKRPWKMAVGATAIVMLAAGCSGGSSSDDASSSNIVVGIGEPQHLVSPNVTESNGAQVMAALYYPLVDFNEQNEPVNVAAESITSDDNKVWTVKLKPGFTFHNGEPVTSDSYINAWNFAAYGPNGQEASYFMERIQGYADLQSEDPDGDDGPQKAPDPKAKTLTGLKKVDDTTFTVTLSAPFIGWKSVMGYTVFNPLPNAAFKADGTIADGFEDAPIGNGPFKMKGTWQHDQQIEVEKFDGFKGTAPKVNGITFKIYQDQKAEYADLIAGNVDVQTQIPLESLAAAPGDLGDRFQKSPASTFQFVGFPTFQKEFAKVEIRKALSMAINRKEMTDQIFLGSATPADDFVSPVVPGYREGACSADCTYNKDEAAKLWKANDGTKSIKITYNADGGHKAWVDAMCNQIKDSLKSEGVDCVGSPEPKFADLLTKVKKKEPVGLIRLGWVMDYPLMENYLGPLYATTGSSNYYGYKNADFDKLVAQGSAAKTTDEAVKIWQQADDMLLRDMPVLPLRFGQNVFGFSEKVKNVKVDTQTKLDVYTVELA
jgi:oligopeptide transport system substrate-binding protein